MAVVPPPRASTRGKAAARPPIKEYPNTLIELISWIVDNDRRTSNCALLVALLIIGCCVVLYTWIAATKGVHALGWRPLLPGGLCGGGALTAVVIVLKLRAVRRRATAAVDPPTTGPSSGQSHMPAPPGGTLDQPR
jgi:hypothetical protein